jgi:thermostable 8-oxoguanine DNA glycosylase
LLILYGEKKSVLRGIYVNEKESKADYRSSFKLDNYRFTSSNAKFIVSAAKQYDESKIKELILK